jgi:hypothetical protein
MKNTIIKNMKKNRNNNNNNNVTKYEIFKNNEYS